jgi:hypothetical protein
LNLVIVWFLRLSIRCEIWSSPKSVGWFKSAGFPKTRIFFGIAFWRYQHTQALLDSIPGGDFTRKRDAAASAR